MATWRLCFRGHVETGLVTDGWSPYRNYKSGCVPTTCSRMSLTSLGMCHEASTTGSGSRVCSSGLGQPKEEDDDAAGLRTGLAGVARSARTISLPVHLQNSLRRQLSQSLRRRGLHPLALVDVERVPFQLPDRVENIAANAAAVYTYVLPEPGNTTKQKRRLGAR